MNASEIAQQLWEQVRKSGQTLEQLNAILNDYQQAMDVLAANDDELRGKLRLQREEIPDLQRLITRKHDAILQGRLQDGIRKLKKLVCPEPPATELPQAEGNKDIATENPEPPKPFRNMPNLGMD